jgi:5-formyltetrahydrofolate cyclo-ligase
MDDKQLLRSRVRAARASRDADHIERVGEALTRHALVQWPGLRVMAAYASVGDEPPTRGLLDAVGATGTRVLLPRVVDRMLEWVEYAGWDGLVVGARELLEPVGDSVPSGVHDVDLMLVPALAVDRTGNRS